MPIHSLPTPAPVFIAPAISARFIGRTATSNIWAGSTTRCKIRGFRVELGEIEAVLASHPGVREAVVLAQGQDAQMRLVAYFIPASDEVATSGALRRHVAAQLPDYMVPSAFVGVDAFPMTANGKLDREALPPPTASRSETDTLFVAPATRWSA